MLLGAQRGPCPIDLVQEFHEVRPVGRPRFVYRVNHIRQRRVVRVATNEPAKHQMVALVNLHHDQRLEDYLHRYTRTCWLLRTISVRKV